MLHFRVDVGFKVSVDVGSSRPALDLIVRPNDLVSDLKARVVAECKITESVELLFGKYILSDNSALAECDVRPQGDEAIQMAIIFPPRKETVRIHPLGPGGDPKTFDKLPSKTISDVVVQMSLDPEEIIVFDETGEPLPL